MITKLEDKMVELVLYRSDVEWDLHWLDCAVTDVFDGIVLKDIFEIVPFFNELAHYSANNIATDDGSLPLSQITNLIEEELGNMQNTVYDKAKARLIKRHGEPKEII